MAALFVRVFHFALVVIVIVVVSLLLLPLLRVFSQLLLLLLLVLPFFVAFLFSPRFVAPIKGLLGDFLPVLSSVETMFMPGHTPHSSILPSPLPPSYSLYNNNKLWLFICSFRLRLRLVFQFCGMKNFIGIAFYCGACFDGFSVGTNCMPLMEHIALVSPRPPLCSFIGVTS